MGRTDFADQFRKIKIIRHKRIGYDLNVMQQSACLVINPITINNVAALFNFTPVDQGSPSVMQHVVSVESSSLLLHSFEARFMCLQ